MIYSTLSSKGLKERSDIRILNCRFYRLSIFIHFLFLSSVFFPVEPENDIRFLEKLIINFWFNFKVKFSLFDTEETKSSIIPIYYM